MHDQTSACKNPDRTAFWGFLVRLTLSFQQRIFENFYCFIHLLHFKLDFFMEAVQASLEH